MADEVLKPEKMQAVYWDFLQADIFTNDFARKDSARDLKTLNAGLQLQIFKKHNTTKEQFYKSYEYYLDHPSLMKDMVDTMMVRHRKPVIPDTSRKPISIDTTKNIVK